MNDEEFVKIWCDAYDKNTGLKQMVIDNSLSYSDTSQRASALRKAGVKLPTMKAKGTKRNVLETDVKMLNGIIVNKLGNESLTWRNR